MTKIRNFVGSLILLYGLSQSAAYAQNMIHAMSKVGETIFKVKSGGYGVELVDQGRDGVLDRVIETLDDTNNEYKKGSIPEFYKNFNNEALPKYIRSELEECVRIAREDPKKVVISKHPESSFNKIGYFKVVGEKGKEYIIEGRMAEEPSRPGATFNTLGLSFYVKNQENPMSGINMTRVLSGPVYDEILKNALELVKIHETRVKQRLDNIVENLSNLIAGSE